MTNSGIEYIQVYVKNKPRSLVEHLGTGRHYNINSKSGNLQLLFSEHSGVNDIYNTDIDNYYSNLECIEAVHYPYVVIAPNYMIYTYRLFQADRCPYRIRCRCDHALSFR